MSTNNNSIVFAAGKVVGEVQGDTFIKRVRGSIHMLRSPKGWALDIQSLADAERVGGRSVEIEDIDSGRTYTATIDHIREKGVLVNRGFGAQIALPLHFWRVEEPGTKQLGMVLR